MRATRGSVGVREAETGAVSGLLVITNCRFQSECIGLSCFFSELVPNAPNAISKNLGFKISA